MVVVVVLFQTVLSNNPAAQRQPIDLPVVTQISPSSRIIYPSLHEVRPTTELEGEREGGRVGERGRGREGKGRSMGNDQYSHCDRDALTNPGRRE